VIRSIRESESQKNTERDIALIHFNFFLGLKAVELCTLKISDVYDGKQLKGTLRMSKPQKEWVLQLSDKYLQRALETYITCRKQSEGKHFSIHSDLFKSQKGSFSKQALSALINKIYKQSGLLGVTGHTGKLSYIKNRLQYGFSVEQIFLITGDVSIKNTQRYVAAVESESLV
jgi:site-specific recombinase XerD